MSAQPNPRSAPTTADETGTEHVAAATAKQPDGVTAPAVPATSQRDDAKTPRTRGQRARSRAQHVAGWTRLVAGLPAIALFVCSVVLVVRTTVSAFEATAEAAVGKIAGTELAIEYVEYADLFLLAVVLYIMALGLFTLFITDKIPLPSWLEFNDFDDLKERLVSVIVVMLGVYFLGVVLNGERGIDLLWLGLAIGAVIAGLTAFAHLVFKGGE